MPTTTMQLIAKQTVGSGGAASVTFSNIPQTYTDLKVVISARSSADMTYAVTFNGSATSYSGISLRGSGAATASYPTSNYAFGSTALGLGYINSVTSTFTNCEIYIPNYTSSNNKSLSADNVQEQNTASPVYANLTAGLWSNTAAITSVGLKTESGTFTEFSEFTLYGISNSTTTQSTTVPYASGGDIISTDGSYWYHTFLYSGTFTPLKNLTCDYLVVAGGGGGGGEAAGGGGGGGYRTSIGGTALSLTANTAYTTIVGAGGTGSGTSGARGASGGNSSFSTISSTGGGGGGSYPDLAGLAGGSGGGGGYFSAAGGAGNAGSYSPVEGYAGSAAFGGGGSDFVSGGGGGAGGAATTGNGANGASNSISGSSITYAGGGGAAVGSAVAAKTGGTGGGGTGARRSTSAATSGTANRGGGGGGGDTGGLTGGNGGSGIIIVRYAV